MPYREVGMVQVREIVRRWLAGDGLRAIARAMGVDRKTVAQYVHVATDVVGLVRGGAPPTEAQLVAIAACRRPGRPSTGLEPSAEIAALWPHQATIRRGLHEDELRRRVSVHGERSDRSNVNSQIGAT